MVPLSSFKFFSSLSLNLFDFMCLRLFSTGVRLVLLGAYIGFSSSSFYSEGIRSFLLRERVELKILLAFTYSKFFLLFNRALLLSCSPSSSIDYFRRLKVWLIMLEH